MEFDAAPVELMAVNHLVRKPRGQGFWVPPNSSVTVECYANANHLKTVEVMTNSAGNGRYYQFGTVLERMDVGTTLTVRYDFTDVSELLRANEKRPVTRINGHPLFNTYPTYYDTMQTLLQQLLNELTTDSLFVTPTIQEVLNWRTMAPSVDLFFGISIHLCGISQIRLCFPTENSSVFS